MSFKKIIFGLILSIALSFSLIAPLSQPVFATKDACEVAGVNDPLICGTKDSNEERELQRRIKRVLETVYLWLGIIAVIVIVIGGIRYMTSTGEPEKIKGAKNTIMYAIIGLIVTLAAFAITEFVIGALEGRAPEGGGTHAEEGGGGSGGGSGGGGGSEGGGETEAVEVKSITIMGISTLKKGEEYGFYTKIIPDYATDKTIKWASSNPKVATVSKEGRVKALEPGQTTITATAHNGKSTSKDVTVPEPILAESVSIDQKVTSITTGKTAQLGAKVAPQNAENKTLTWSSSDQNIITVDDKGKIKAVKKGTATITVKTSNGKSDSVKITVADAAEVVTQDKVKKLQETVKTYAWPSYKGRGYRHQKSEYTKAYKAATAAGWVSNKDCKGDDCGVFVLITMRNSGWEPKYPNKRTGGQYEWLSNPKHGWEDVTKKIKSNADAKPGDVIITRGQGHVLLYMGKVDGFSSKMASASYCGRSPMADGNKNIYHYVTHSHSNGKKYAIFRKKNQ